MLGDWRLVWHLCVCLCVCECVCVFSFLVNNTEGVKAIAGLYSLQSSVSIIKEWYLQRGTEVKRVALERRDGKKVKKGRRLYYDELLPYM